MGEFTFFSFVVYLTAMVILDRYGQCTQLSGEEWLWSFVLVGVLDIPAIYQCMYGVTFNLYLHTLGKTYAPPTFILAITTSWIMVIFIHVDLCYIYLLTISVIWIILASVAFNFLLTMLRFFCLTFSNNWYCFPFWCFFILVFKTQELRLDCNQLYCLIFFL